MSILSIWKAQPTLLDEKSVKQLISIAGNGWLTDGSATCEEFRALLSEVPAERIVQYADECLKEGFTDSGLALQDIINEVGRRLGFGVTHGRYRGKTGAIGNDEAVGCVSRLFALWAAGKSASNTAISAMGKQYLAKILHH